MKVFSKQDVSKATQQLLSQINSHVINTNNLKFKDLKEGKIKFVNKLETINPEQLCKAIRQYAITTKTDIRDIATAIALVNDIHNYTFQVICKKAANEAAKDREAWKSEHHPSENNNR